MRLPDRQENQELLASTLLQTLQRLDQSMVASGLLPPVDGKQPGARDHAKMIDARFVQDRSR